MQNSAEAIDSMKASGCSHVRMGGCRGDGGFCRQVPPEHSRTYREFL
ncbi:MAG: hypothetical protein HC781_05905 [Leptolyngbyaceae cyanobacterium CSU_1_4]|nr:hypothetical protein [Leptolyngbyaceae cyanobacterium CSU_1_4]